MMKKHRYVVEYSQSQKAFHIQPMTDAVEANARRFWHRPNEMFDWVPVYVGTRRQCELMVVQSEQRIRKEEEPVQWMH